MKKIYLFIALFAAASTACNKSDIEPIQKGEEPVVEVKMITETVMGGKGSTKATIANAAASFSWTTGDNIAVHVSNGDSHKYVFTSDAGASGASESVASASFTVVYPEGYSRDAFALFPSTLVSENAANYGQSGTALDVTLPSSYTLAQVSDETSPCPMIATNNAGSGWNFYQLCCLLRLTVKSIPPTTKRLVIDFDGKKVCGDFSIASPVNPGASEIATTADAEHDIITITKDGTDVTLNNNAWLDGLVVNIPLPTGAYTNITVTAYDALTGGNAILTMTRGLSYTASNSRAKKFTMSFPSSKTAFRGYEVSTGILERSKVGDNPATYSLTSGEMILTYDPVSKKEIYALPAGCNPFEPAINYGQSSALNKYFHKWLTLRNELGANGNNINATSVKLPAGWQFPSSGGSSHDPVYDWGTILFGAPKSPITVNGETLKKIDYLYYTPFALVAVTLEAGNGYSVPAGTYYGLFLIRDGLTIPTGYFSKIGLNNYTDNPLNETQFNDLIRMGCLFISASGYYSELFSSWRDLSSSDPEGYYWSNIYSSDTKFFRCNFYNSHVSATGGSSTSHNDYYVVKLVKPVNP